MKYITVIFFLIIISCGISGIYSVKSDLLDSKKFSSNHLQHRLILIGDAGDPIETLPIANYEAIKRFIKQAPEKHLTVFLGDNIYPLGLPDKSDNGYSDYLNVLDQQLNISKETNSFALMIPGNHDWAKGKGYGLEQIKRQSKHVNQSGENNVFRPKSGSIEPVLIDTLGYQLIVIDSHQWITEIEKTNSTEQFKGFLNQLQINDKNPLLIVAHHPLMTNGSHGGYFTILQHLFPLTEFNSAYLLPLPVVGSIYPLLRSSGYSIQDVSSNSYQMYIDLMTRYIETHPVLVYAAGHEHALQVFDHNTYFSLVSGTGRETGLANITTNAQMLFGSEQAGFMSLDILQNGSIYLNVWHSDSSSTALLVYSKRIK